jgi:Na+-transporting methylmalonyl-CoA/oxaloacetate decarboxylase gamma subunit
MTPTSTLVFGAVAILVVVAWFVFGVIDGTRPEPVRAPEKAADEQTPVGTRG